MQLVQKEQNYDHFLKWHKLTQMCTSRAFKQSIALSKQLTQPLNSKTSQELRMLSSVTINCQVRMIV